MPRGRQETRPWGHGRWELGRKTLALSQDPERAAPI